jgi:tetratricopeptide (TPR) repeat protein
MDLLASNIDPSALFVNAAQLQQQMENIANMALSAGIDHYQNKRYKEAAAAFGRSIALLPTSSYATQAAEYQASSYLKLGRTDKAVEAYETATRLDPQNEGSLVKLGNLLFSEKRFKEAETTYHKAVLINPNSTNRYSLGQAYLVNGNYNRAESEFSEVARLIPDEPNGFFGLAQTYAKQNRYDKSIEYFNIAIEKDPEFYSANLELGFTLADAGRMDEAMAQFEYLEEKDENLADQLNRYIYKVDKPKIMFASSLSSFKFTMPMRTTLSALDSYLANANAEKTFTMIFQFDKEMDRESVEDIYNWEIKRSDKSGSGGKYNYGLSIDDTEITLPIYPANVYYDEKNLTATLRFNLTQNSEGNGTIDPSHVLFQFKGEDTYGNAVDSGHDEFMGFSRVV